MVKSGVPAPVLDEQAVMEAALTLFAATLNGGNLIHDIGYMESGLTGSLELVVICDEIISWLTAFTGGLEISEETLALDLIHQHALTGEFLGTDHTLRHVREGWEPRLVDRQNYDKWVESDGTTMGERARVKVTNASPHTTASPLRTGGCAVAVVNPFQRVSRIRA